MNTQILGGLAGVLSAAAAIGQDRPPELDHRSFLPHDYTLEAFVDVDAVRQAGLGRLAGRALWLAPLTQTLRRDLSTTWAQVRDIRLAQVARLAAADEPDGRIEIDHVRIVRGELQPRRLEVRSSRNGLLDAHPRPDTVVTGNTAWMERVAAGKTRGGVPHPVLTALQAGPKPLAFFAARVGWLRDELRAAFATAPSSLQSVMVRLHRTPDEEGFSVWATARFAEAGPGLQQLRQGIAAALKTHRTSLTPAHRDLVDRIEWSVDGADLQAKLTLRNRQAVTDAMAALETIPLLGRHHVVVGDYELARALARDSGRQLLVNLSGINCINCQLMQKQVFSSSAVRNLLVRGFVEARLHVDLPAKHRNAPYSKRIQELRHKFVGANLAIPHLIVVDPRSEQVRRRSSGLKASTALLKFLKGEG